jgi:nicotinate-nucleotide adenylyltransferase
MNIGLYFGSFNPVHKGHTAIAEYMYRYFHFDAIWFVVSPSNPLKQEATLLDEYKRLELVKIAIRDKPYFRVSDIEFTMAKPSYTYLTLRKIRLEYPDHHCSLIVGSDSIENIVLWKKHQEILQNYSILVYPRSQKAMPFVQQNVIYTHPKMLDISSTVIREKIKRRESVVDLLQLEVLQIIEREQYYR